MTKQTKIRVTKLCIRLPNKGILAAKALRSTRTWNNKWVAVIIIISNYTDQGVLCLCFAIIRISYQGNVDYSSFPPATMCCCCKLLPFTCFEVSVVALLL